MKFDVGTPLAEATIFIWKLKKSMVTDANGEFSLKNVPDGEYEEEISLVGYETCVTKIVVANYGSVLTAA